MNGVTVIPQEASTTRDVRVEMRTRCGRNIKNISGVQYAGRTSFPNIKESSMDRSRLELQH